MKVKVKIAKHVYQKNFNLDDSSNRKICAICGKKLGNKPFLTYADNVEAKKGQEVIFSGYSEEGLGYHDITNGGGCLEVYIGSECVKKLNWEEIELDTEEDSV